MTDNELDQLMQRVLLDAIKKDCETENSVVPSFNPSPRYQRSLVAMIADPLKWTRKRATPLWKKILQKVAIVLIVFSLSLGSLMAVSPNIRAAVVNWVTEWYETHITYRYLGTPTDNGMPKYRIEALPNGYVEVDSEREEWSDYICIVYRNEASGKTIYFDYTRMTQGYVNDFEVNSDTPAKSGRTPTVKRREAAATSSSACWCAGWSYIFCPQSHRCFLRHHTPHQNHEACDTAYHL